VDKVLMTVIVNCRLHSLIARDWTRFPFTLVLLYSHVIVRYSAFFPFCVAKKKKWTDLEKK